MQGAYPAGPQNVPGDLTAPTATYRRRAWFAVASLAVFVILYVALAGWFVWKAVWLLTNTADARHGDGLLMVIGGAGAAFLAVFMLKALFFVRRGEAPDAIEVTSTDQPRLFTFLNRIADEAGAPRPHRVFLSARVNAAVFYDLSLINLVIPSRKNLEIGLALVNVLTLSELKAVLAHEFGHFAQRTMAVGSWVYIAHQIAAHMVAKRDALDRVLAYLSGLDVRVAWFGWMLSLIVWSIRSLMDTLLRLVLIAQRALSREMEFQADLVAVSLTGSDELVHALHKLHAADDAWGRTVGFLGSEVKSGRLPHDLFAVQTRVIDVVGRILDNDTYGRVPSRAEAQAPEGHRVFKSAFAQPPQMWSTHPANAERERNAKQRYVPAPHDPRSAWDVFDGIGALKDGVVRRLVGDAVAGTASEEETFGILEANYAMLRYEPRFRGAYLGRPLTRHAGSPDELPGQVLSHPDVLAALEDLYPESLSADLDRLRELSEERSLLEALRDRTFEATGGRIVFRGREIARRDLPEAIREVLREEHEVRERVLDHDRRCRGSHLAAARRLGAGWENYLRGLIAALHYAEHTRDDLVDARGLFANVFAIVVADRKVTRKELNRLVEAADALYSVLSAIYATRSTVRLDIILCDRLGVPAWEHALGDWRLPRPTEQNLSEWLQEFDGWVDAAVGALSALASAATEQLLATEDEMARRLRSGEAPIAAPRATSIDARYVSLLPGAERKRQKRLGLWDRFQTADGIVAAALRLVVAVAIVASVLWFGSGVKID